MAYIPESQSVVAFQSDASKLKATTYQEAGSVLAVSGSFSPAGNQSVSGTVQTDVRGSVAAVIIGGSIAASFTPPANQSVSGEVNVVQTTSPWIITGSVQASLTPAANQSVSGTVQTEPLSTNASIITVGKGSIATVIIGGSIAASFTPPANQSVSGEVNVVQTTSPWVVAPNNSSLFSLQPAGSILAVSGSFSTANQSVSGTVGTRIESTNASVVVVGQGSVAVAIVSGSIAASFTPPANQSVSGEVSVSNFPTTQNVSGSVVAFQGTPEWTIKSSLAGGIFPVSGSVAATITNTNINIGGSVAAWLQSTNASVITVGTAAPNQSVSGAVSVSNFPANQSVSGTVGTTQIGTWNTSITSTVPSSVLVGASIFGQLPAGTAVLGSVAALQGTNPWIVGYTSGSVAVNGSVVAFPGTSPWPVVNVGSIISLNIGSVISVTQGSVATVQIGQSGTVITSISGIPQASVHGAVFIASASLVSGHGSVNGAASVQVLSAPGTGLYNYVTDFTLSNTGAATTLVNFKDGDGSIMGRSIAPTGGGAIAAGFLSPMKTLQTNKVVNIEAVTATSVLYAWVAGYKAP